MEPGTMNRRSLVAAAAGAIAIHAAGRRVTAQTPVVDIGQSVTTETFGREISWSDPWVRDESVPLTGDTELIDEETDEVIEMVAFDKVELDHPNGAFGEFIFAPSPGENARWEIRYRWTQIDGYTSVDSGSTESFWYNLDYFVYDGEEYGRFVKGTYPDDNEYVETVVLTAPVAGFGTSLDAYLAEVMLDGEPPFTNVDPAGLQAALDPLIGTGLEAVPEVEATPAT